MKRETAARLVSLAGGIIALAVMWQAVRFCQGLIGAPILDLFNELWREAKGQQADAQPLFSPLGDLFAMGAHYFGGIAHWVGLGGLVLALTVPCERIVEVGWSQYRAEQREANELARQAAQRQALKDRRRELRRKVLERQEPRKSSFSFGSFLLGLMIGSFFL